MQQGRIIPHLLVTVLIMIMGVIPLLPGNTAEAQVVSTVVGGGACDTCPATEAVLYNPSDVLLDGLGNVYIADFNNDRVRKVDSSGVITSVAGNGLKGFKGDGGPATAASLNGPFGITFDLSGNLLITESVNNRIRKVDLSTGIITTIAGTGVAGFGGDGGPATAALLNVPRHIIVSSSGDIYFSEVGNERVRKIDVNGIITTVAGNGIEGFSGDGGPATSARLFNPFGLAFDTQGNLFIADVDNHRVRRVSTTGIITTVAGTGSFTFSGDGGRATLAGIASPTRMTFDPVGNMYVPSSIPNHRVRKIVAGTDGLITGAADEIISTIAGNGVGGYGGDGGAATAASINRPFAISRDSAGNLFVADFGNLRVRQIDPSGTITTYAGNGLCCYSADQRPAIQATLNFPTGITRDGAGNYYIADRDNNRIRVVNNQASPITVAGLTINPGNIRTIAGTGAAGYGGDNGPAASAVVNKPYYIEVDPAGNIYFSDFANHRVRKIDTAGTITTVAGTGVAGYSGNNGLATSAAFNGPLGLALDSAGNLFISDLNNHRVRRVSTTGVVTSVVGNGTTAFAGDGGPATSAAISNPTDISLDASGALYIPLSAPQHRVRKVVPGSDGLITGAADEIITTVAGNGVAAGGGDGGPATAASLNRPFGTLVDPSGTLFIADASNFKVRTVTSGTIAAHVGNGTKTHAIDFEGGNIPPPNLTDELGDGLAGTSATTGFPAQLALHGPALLFADGANHRIRGLGVPAGDTTPPSVPTGLAASNVQCNSVTLTWNASSDNVGVTAYKVYRNSVLIATVTAPTTTYTDTTVAASTAYSYTVSAVDAAANESAQSTPPANVTTPACPDTTPPTVPTNVATSNVQCNSVTVTWTASTDNVGVTAYKVYRNSVLIATVAAPTTTYTDTTVAASTAYSYTVSAVDAAANESAQSTPPANVTTPACPDTTPPTVPTNVATSNVQCNSVTVSWTASTDDVGVTAYKVYRDSVLIATVTAPTTTYTDTTVAASTAYSYTVSAVDAAANESAQSTPPANVTTPACPDTTPPTVPTNVATSNVQCNSVTLTWTASTDNVGVTAYKVYRNSVLIATVTAPTTTYTDTTVAASTAYSYTVSAVDAAANESAQSTPPANVTTPACPDTEPPSAPTAVATTSVQCNSVALTWSASTDNVGVTAYKVYRNASLIATVAAPTTSYTDSTVAASTTYSYTVAAEDGAGNPSAQSVALSVTTPACGPESTATIRIEPETVNKDSSGVPINVFISVDGPHVATDILINSGFTVDMTFPTPLPATCSTPVLPHTAGTEIFTGNNQLNVKFDRQTVEDCVNVGQDIVLTVNGTFNDSHTFSGYDTVRVIQ